jgi:hypothetical protein
MPLPIPFYLRLSQPNALTYGEMDGNFTILSQKIDNTVGTNVGSGIGIYLNKTVNPNDGFLNFRTLAGGGGVKVFVSGDSIMITGHTAPEIDINVTGGTYNPVNGCATFITNSGNTFEVCGFLTGYTDSFTDAATLSGTSITFDNTTEGPNFYSVDLWPLLSGYTDSYTDAAYLSGTSIIFDNTLLGPNYYNVNLASLLSGASSDCCYWTAGTGTNAVKLINNGGTASGILAVSEGSGTTASGNVSHAEGLNTIASGDVAHAGGHGFDISNRIIASGKTSFIHFERTTGSIGGTTPIGAYSPNSVILGGRDHNIEEGNVNSIIIGGDSNEMEGPNSQNTFIIGGETNILNITSGWKSCGIVGGLDNSIGDLSGLAARAQHSVIVGGDDNEILGIVSDSIILGGDNNTLSFSDQSFLIGVTTSIISGSTTTGSTNSGIIGGNNQEVYSSTNSVIVGGDGNIIDGFSNTVILGGQNITGTADDTVYVPQLNIGTVRTTTSTANLGIDVDGFVTTGATSSGGTFNWCDPYVRAGNTSGCCINELWVTTISGCSPVTIGSSIQSSGGNASGINSLSYGEGTIASGENSQALGKDTVASGESAHAEGYLTKAHGENSHAEGRKTLANGEAAHAEGNYTIAKGIYSHAEGQYTKALGPYSHAGGMGNDPNRVIAEGEASFAHYKTTETPNSGVYGEAAAILGGLDHTIHQSATSSAILAGSAHHISGDTNTSAIIAGQNNIITAISGSTAMSAILGGNGHTIDATRRSVILGGLSINATVDDAAYVPKLNIGTPLTNTPQYGLGLDTNGFVVQTTAVASASTWSWCDLPSSGNTSGCCISDLWVSNIHSCSPLNINPGDEGNVYFGCNVAITGASKTLTINDYSFPVGGGTEGEVMVYDAGTNSLKFSSFTGNTSGNLFSSTERSVGNTPLNFDGFFEGGATGYTTYTIQNPYSDDPNSMLTGNTLPSSTGGTFTGKTYTLPSGTLNDGDVLNFKLKFSRGILGDLIVPVTDEKIAVTSISNTQLRVDGEFYDDNFIITTSDTWDDDLDPIALTAGTVYGTGFMYRSDKPPTLTDAELTGTTLLNWDTLVDIDMVRVDATTLNITTNVNYKIHQPWNVFASSTVRGYSFDALHSSSNTNFTVNDMDSNSIVFDAAGWTFGGIGLFSGGTQEKIYCDYMIIDLNRKI